MSSIKTTQIDGDVSVGRNVAMGGKARIAGSVNIGHNLKVDGWLEAVNIKGVNKGIFLTVEALREAYPNPHDGWFAGVGDGTPFDAYIGHGGEWVATGGTIEVTVDMTQYTEDVEQLQGEVTQINEALDDKADLDDWGNNAKKVVLSQMPVCALFNIEAIDTTTPSSSVVSNNKMWYYHNSGDDHKLYYRDNSGTDHELGAPPYMLYYNGNSVYRWNGSGFSKIVSADIDLSNYFTKSEVNTILADYATLNTLSGYFTKGEVNTLLAGYVTLSTYNDAIAGLNLGTKANLLDGKAMPSRLTPGEWPEVVLYNVVPISPLEPESYDWDAIPVGSIYLEDGLNGNTPYRKLFKKSNIEQIGIVDLGAPQAGTIYCHKDTGNTYRWDQSADSGLGEFVQIGSLGTDAVREFSAILPSATVAQSSTAKKSTDSDCQVFYVTSLNQFVLGVRNSLVPQNWPSSDVQPVHLMALNAVQRSITVQPNVAFADLVVADLVRQQILVDYYTFYLDWADRDLFSENVDNVFVPYANKLYICTSSDVSYYWNTEVSSLTAISDPGLSARLFFNGNVLTGNESSEITLSQFVALTTGSAFAYIRQKGVVITLSTPSGLKSYQWRGTTWSDVDDWRDFGGSASVGNCYNVTNEVPTQGYYTLGTAISATYTKGLAAAGMQITFQVGVGTWKTYQYVGSDTTQANFTNQDNWVDMAGLAAGDEAILNIYDLCGACAQTNTGYYTLQYAIAALGTKESSTGITYKKSGLVITYPVGDNQWETKQFNGNVSDFGETALWHDFGGGGDVETLEASDDPADGGEDAFSTGGAYNHLAKGMEMLSVEEAEELVENADNENNYYFVLVNVDGNRVPDFAPFAIPKGGGSGSGTTKTFAINFQSSPFYAAAGGSFILRAAIRSVTMDGSTEVTNTIERVDIIDRDTAAVLYSNRTLNRASSATSSTYDFVFDLSAYFTAATTRRLQLVAYDDEGGTTQRAINVVAVDVTVESVQTLNYTDASVVFRTDTAKSLSMYKFPNNQGGQGILAKVELYYNNAWRTLGEAVITDTYAHNISVSPNNACGNGETLHHGAHRIRIQGTDVASGVKGNIIYSTIMVVEADNLTPIVAMRYNDNGGTGTVRRFDTVSLEVAAYDPRNYNATVEVKENGSTIATFTVARNAVQTVTRQITSGSDGDTLVYVAICGVSSSGTLTLTIQGSAIAAGLSDGANYNFDFSTRTNSETDHSITSGQDDQYEIAVDGANWSSNGFNSYLGANALAIKENVTAELNDAPFGTADIASTGFALLFQFAAANIANNDTKLMSCGTLGSGAGFYVTGQSVGIFCGNKVEERTYPLGEKITVGLVVEPTTVYEEFNGIHYSLIKLFLNGEECACVEYTSSGDLLQPGNIQFNGEDGDFYLYYLIGWRNYNVMQWHQAFYNYLVKLTDTDDMIAEYAFEDVWSGNTSNGPTLSELDERGMPYLIESPFQGSNVEGLDNTTSTSDNIFINLTYRDPSRPWRDFIAYNVRRRNQGTTSAKRPVKNARYNLARKSKNNATYVVDGVTYTKVCIIKPLHTREEIVAMGYDGALWDEAAALMAKNKIRVGEDTIPVDVITVKVDYSDSTNANDCGACNMMNATYRALGSQYMTPAQRHFDGTYSIGSGDSIVQLTGLQMNHSTANHPIAMYRDLDGSGTTLKFYAKGNWKEDKGEQVALGFKDTPGYNKGCLNYGDFVEYFGLAEDDTIQKVVNRFVAEVTADPNAYDQNYPVLLSMYCGSSYKFYRYQNGAWTDTTGTMRMVNGHWQITGDVLNPVDGYELLAYQGMCWWRGVSSVADMMSPTTSHSSWVKKLGYTEGQTVPAWTQYFECMVDDDILQQDLAAGRKVPYWLYRLLKFCNDCDFNDVNVNLAGYWHDNLYKYVNVHALYAYNGFTDYLAAVDQQAKNMQPMFFLDDGGEVVNGVYNDEAYVRMYPNKVYDADTLLGKDNAGGATVDPEVDPNKPDDVGYTNPYAGWGSVLWNNIYRQPTVKYNASNEVSMRTVVAAMRSAQATIDGITFVPFSPDGCKHFFIDNICKRWQKTVSSYDGENKYIKSTSRIDTTVDGNESTYFYALHGLRLTALPSFIDRRFRIRDGFYGTGLFFTGVFSARINAAAGTGITIKAAKTGYFGVGSDNSGNLRESVYLEEGETHRFTQFDHTSGSLLYIYQANRMSEVDLSEISLSQTDTTSFSVFSLAQKISLGSETHTNLAVGSYAVLTIPSFGSLPFLTHLDVRNTLVTTVDVSRCPRLVSLLATGSQLTSVTLAETSPISTLSLPSTVTELKMVNLPRLSYPGGLTFDGMSNISRLMVSGCPQIDGAQLLSDIVNAGATLSRLRLTGLNVTGSRATLDALMSMGVTGLAADGTAYTETGQCSGLEGVWVMSSYIDTNDLTSIQHYFPELDVYNAQYTVIEMDDTLTDDANMTNLDNGTTGTTGLNKYTPSGHISRIQEMIHTYKCTFVAATGSDEAYMQAEQISDDNLQYLYDANSTSHLGDYVDITDGDDLGYDIMTKLPDFWYKGINDHLHQKKYLLLSSDTTRPRSSATVTRRAVASTLLFAEGKVANASDFSEGDTFEESNLSTNVSYNTHRMDVEGMKQVRWPGVSSSSMCSLFLDSDGKVLQVVVTNITATNNDYVGGEYMFTNVPANAKWFLFAALPSSSSVECIAVDSTALEAIEPDWVHNDASLVGTYLGSWVNNRYRSLSGKSVRYGTNNDGVASGWVYDNNGNLDIVNSDVSTISKWSWMDFRNAAYMRGAGYQLMDYEQHKIYAVLWMAIHGRRNINGPVGARNYNASNATGTSNGNFTGHLNDKSCRSLGVEDPWGAAWQWIDNVAVNVASYAGFRSKTDPTTGSSKTVGAAPSGSTVDHIWRVYDPIAKTERAVRGVSGSTEIARVRWGRFCDVVPSSLISNSNYNTYYCDQQEYSASTARVVRRAGNYASAACGLVYVNASGGYSGANGYSGGRLAFRGVIVER